MPEQIMGATGGPRLYTRRDVLRLSARAVLALPVVGTALAACGEDAANGPAGAQLDRPLRLRHDSAVGPLFEPYIQHFNDTYDLQLETAYATGDYFALTNQQLAGGAVDYDILFADDGWMERWYGNGWIREVEEFPGVQELLGDMSPGVEDSIRAQDGRLVALPYFRGAEIFVYNVEHLEQLGAEPPRTWDEFLDQCRELHGSGISSMPYSPYWIAFAFLMWIQFGSEAYADGAAPFFGQDFSPDFATDDAVVHTLERWKTMVDEGLVSRDVFTTDYGGITNAFGGGASTFSLRYQPQLVGWNDPEQSQVAGQFRNAILPGSAGTTLSFGANWFMADSAPDPEAAWQLMTYLGGRDQDGEYYVPKNLVAIDLGLGTGYAAADSDPAVRESWAAWSDIDILTDQLDNAAVFGAVVHQPWYTEFAEVAVRELQEAVRGTKPIPDALSDMADFVNNQG